MGVTARQRAAAQLRRTLDRLEGLPTPSWIIAIGEASESRSLNVDANEQRTDQDRQQTSGDSAGAEAVDDLRVEESVVGLDERTATITWIRDWPTKTNGKQPGSPRKNAPLGYDVATVLQAVSITRRQLDQWSAVNLVKPTIPSPDSLETPGTFLYSFKEIITLKIVKRLFDTGVSLENMSTAVNHLKDRDFSELNGVTLFSDGAAVYETRSAEEIVELLQSGKGLFGISVGGTMRELTEKMTDDFLDSVNHSSTA